MIAFPKTQSGQELMVHSPDRVDAHQLDDLHIQVVDDEEDEGGDQHKLVKQPS